jgi:serine/threonine protein kinase
MQGGLERAAGVREGDVLADKYRIETVLGIGGMGVVVAARHVLLDEKVAIKFLLPEMLANHEAVARFEREARAAVRIKSEHVARVLDVGHLPNGAPYMVMEFLDGGDLSSWLKQRGPLSVEQSLDFVLQACVAVADAHALGIIHRDLKPANLFCVRRSDGQLNIKVLDFGISKINDLNASGMSVTKTSSMMGSPQYMSPEQMRSSKNVDVRTDIWALGVVLFELIVGRPPFVADSVTELAIKIAMEPSPHMSALRSDVPEGLDKVILKCLAKVLNERYQNVAELAWALLPFAPKRATGSVERIAAILQGSGPSPNALVSPPLANVTGTPPFSGTVSPTGRTTNGVSPRKMTVIGTVLLGAVVAAIATFVLLFKSASVPRQDQKPVAAAQAAPTEGPVDVPSPPSPQAAKTEIALPDATLGPGEPPAARTIPVRPPSATPAPHSTKKGPANTTATPAPPPTTPAAAAPAPAPRPTATRANCDPPYFFDGDGNRIFKAECL